MATPATTTTTATSSKRVAAPPLFDVFLVTELATHGAAGSSHTAPTSAAAVARIITQYPPAQGSSATDASSSLPKDVADFCFPDAGASAVAAGYGPSAGGVAAAPIGDLASSVAAALESTMLEHLAPYELQCVLCASAYKQRGAHSQWFWLVAWFGAAGMSTRSL